MMNPAPHASYWPYRFSVSEPQIIAAHKHQPLPLRLQSNSALAEAVGEFLDRGGVIRHLPDGPEPMRFTVGGDVVKYVGYEDIFRAFDEWEAA